MARTSFELRADRGIGAGRRFPRRGRGLRYVIARLRDWSGSTDAVRLGASGEGLDSGSARYADLAKVEARLMHIYATAEGESV